MINTLAIATAITITVTVTVIVTVTVTVAVLLRLVYTGDFCRATRCNFCRSKIASSFKHVRNPCDIAATNRTKNTCNFEVATLARQKIAYVNGPLDSHSSQDF